MESTKIQGLDKEIKLFPYLDKFPRLGENVFLAPGVKIAGEVEIGNDSSIWYNTVIRGDVNFVTIGKMTNVQDSSTLHVTNGKFPLIIGNKVTIGHSVVLHGCTLKDLCLIGMRSVVLDGAIVEENSIVAAGAVVIPGFVVPSGKLVAGVPGKVIRDLKNEELEDLEKSAERYVKYAELTLESLKRIGY
jgi:gamma-carbonic anhydrase